MRVRIAVLAVLLMAAVALTGCDLISQIIGEATAGGAPSAFTAARVAFSLLANVARSDAQAQSTVLEEKTLLIAFEASGIYSAATRTFTATWDGGSFSETFMSIRLDATETSVEVFEVRQARDHAGGAWTQRVEISGHDVPFLLNTASSKQFLIEGPGTAAIVDSIDYREWPSSVDGKADPSYRLWPPQLENIWDDETSYVEIELSQ